METCSFCDRTKEELINKNIMLIGGDNANEDYICGDCVTAIRTELIKEGIVEDKVES